MLNQRYANQVEKTPDHIAVKLGEHWLTYRELERQAQSTAYEIEAQWPGTAQSETVGLLFNHGIDMIIAILAALKAGKTYVPLPADYPHNRLSYMLEHSRAAIIITHTPCKNLADTLSKTVLLPTLDIVHCTRHESRTGTGAGNLPNRKMNNQPAYIMYTSGSTGKPKGVVQTHENIYYHIEPWAQTFAVGPGHRLTLFSSFGHDASVMDIYGALLNGAALYPLNMRDRDENTEISEFLVREQITVWHSVPSLFNFFTNTLSGTEEFKHLRYIILGGEAVRQHEIHRCQLHFPHSTLATIYGQTESSVNSIWLVRPDERVDKFILGPPLEKTGLFVVDEDGNEVNPLRTGEILVASPHISPGYWRDKEATARCFDEDDEFGRLYWSGDMGRLLLDGNIEFMGRKDTQVKIRGFRIETGEIETILLRCPGIKEAVVTARQDEQGEPYLCAYLVNAPIEPNPVESKETPDRTLLREALARELPDYMIPSFFVTLSELPLTQSGKIDRNALPEPEIKSAKTYKPPTDHTENTMVRLWEEILNLPPGKIGRDDNFFELGGHSLRAAVLAARVHKVLNAKITLAQVFKTPTLSGLSRCVKESGKDEYEGILAAEKKEYYPLTPAQKRLYILQQMESRTTVYNLTRKEHLQGPIDIRRVEKTLHLLIDRHESLRTSIHLVNETPVQRIHDRVEFKIDVITLPTGKTADGYLQRFISPFDLTRPPLLRVGILQTAAETVVLVVDIHHIVTDGTSQRILLEEFKELYEGSEIRPLKLQYKDYAQWQNRTEQLTVSRGQESYWREELRGEIPVLHLPYDNPRPIVQSFAGANLGYALTVEETHRLQALAMAEDTTLYTVLLTILQILLSKLSGQEEMIIGTAVAGRRHADLQHIIGMFVNTLALRTYIHGDNPYTEFLSLVKDKVMQSFENQEYPFEELVENLQIPREAGRNPLFDVMFTLQNMAEFNTGEIEEHRDNSEQINSRKQDRPTLENRVAQFDLTVTAAVVNEKIRFNINYCTALFRKNTIERWNSYYKKIVAAVLESPQAKIAEIEIISGEEKRQILLDFNETGPWNREDKTIHGLFTELSGKKPDKIAVIGTGHRGQQKSIQTFKNRRDREVNASPCAHSFSRETHLSYGKLHEQTHHVSMMLRDQGVKTDTIVALNVERTLEMIIGIISILSAGGAYLPIDPSYPQERVNYMLADSGAQILVTAEILETMPYMSQRSYSTYTTEIPSSHSLAYVIYTSGTTGKPKGTLTTHANVTRVVKDTNYIDITETDRVLQLSNYAFDGSVFDIYGALLNGAALVTIKKEDVLTIDRLSNRVKQQAVTLFFITTALFNTLVDMGIDSLRGLRKILFGGEKVSLPHTRKALENLGKDKILHVYGPTETTVYATYYRVDEIPGTAETVPIGKPISKTVIYILDQWMQLVPVGVTGEIFIGGDGVARGYLNRPELTSEKFIDNPKKLYMSPLPNLPHLPHPPYTAYSSTKLYKTGDLARWHPEGHIEFQGRRDHQVKIRGNRIECTEIETHLLAIREIKNALVEARSDSPGDTYLCAYIVSETKVDAAGLKTILAGKLPEYMIPTHIMQLDEIPLTANGKIDRKALPAPVVTPGSAYTPPRTPLEKQLADIWGEILGLNPSGAGQKKQRIGIDDDFFQLGGHSLKATLLAAKIQKSFNIKIPLVEIFRSPTIKSIAQFINRSEEEQFMTIQPVEKREYYELSPTQKRQYILQQMETEHTGYNVTQIIPLPGEIDGQRLESAFKRLIARHESLRTSFHLVNDMPVQRIQRHVEFEIEVLTHTKNDAEEELPKNRQLKTNSDLKTFTRPFDLSRAPLLRVGLINKDNRENLLWIDLHHIITDGATQSILVKEILQLYEGKELPPLRIQYKEYAHWQNSRKQRQAIQDTAAYWHNLYPPSAELPILNLPVDNPRPAVQRFDGGKVEFLLTPKETLAIKTLARQADTTLFMAIAAIFYILLSKLTGQEDIILGTPVAGRRHADLEGIIGMFVNTLALRNTPLGEKTCIEFLNEVKTNTLNAFENQEYPFEELVERLAVPRETGRNPMFDVMFNLLNQADYTSTPGTAGQDRQYMKRHREGTAKFDLVLTALDLGENLWSAIEYSSILFNPETIDRIILYFRETAAAITESPQRRIAEIEIITPEEREKILTEFNRPIGPIPRDKTIHELVIRQSRQTPDYIALVGPHCNSNIADMSYMSHLSYQELNARSGQMAANLKEKGLLPGGIAAVVLERSIEMVNAILAILKAGSAYLPIDPQNPPERIDYMLADSGAQTLVTAKTMTAASNIAHPSHTSYMSHTLGDTPYTPGSTLAYIIYTSGTTGKPKGVPIPHGGLINLIYAHWEVFGEKPHTRISQVSSPGFDAMASEVWPCLAGGATLVIVDNETRLDAAQLKQWLIEKQITHSFQSTAIAELLLEENWTGTGTALKILRTGGDRLTRYPKGEMPFTLYNLYGPTEDTVCTTWTEIKPAKETNALPSIGKPIPNHRVYILGPNLEIQPIGVTGELCITGQGVAPGYLNKPELTAEKFVLNPNKFNRSYTSHKAYNYSTKLYKTGDLARWQPDGKIDILGRIDTQVKIRGNRIELGEIEHRIQGYNNIKEAVVTAAADKNGDKTLCAYYTSDRDIDIPALRKYMSETLPGYMIPTYFVRMPQIPLTPNGKIDRKALPHPEIQPAINYVPPRNPLEKRLVEIWRDVLGGSQPSQPGETQRIGIHDNFFEIGGHSLKATTLISKIHKETDVKIPLVTIFNTPTIQGLADYIKNKKKERHIAISPVEKKEYYPLSSAQNRLHIINRMTADNIAYNVPISIPVQGDIDKEQLKSIFKSLITRHESLRTSIHIVNDIPVQRIHDQVEFEIEEVTLPKVPRVPKDEEKLAKSRDQIANNYLKHFIRPFDLSRAPLLRVGLVKKETPATLLLIDMHHIVTDGTSHTILTREFMLLYKGKTLHPLRVQYKDYAQRQRSESYQTFVRNQEAFWLKEFSGEIPVLHMPTDYPRPREQSFAGNSVYFALDAATAKSLKRLVQQTQGTLFITILSIFNILMAKISSQEDIIVGTSLAGRRHDDLREVIGMFVSTLALRNFPRGEKKFLDFLLEVKTRTLEAFENQEYPFEELVEKLPVTRDTARNPLFDVMVNVLNMVEPQDNAMNPTQKGLNLERHKESAAKFDLTLTVLEIGENLQFSIDYCSALFAPTTIDRIIGYFRTAIESLTANPQIPISHLEILSTPERNRILHEFNNATPGIPREKSIPGLFARQVEQNPDRIALAELPERREEHKKSGKTTHISYKNLNQKAHRLALHVKEKGVAPETIAAVMCHRSMEMIIAIIGILKAGGAYLPIDPSTPEERIKYMLADSGAQTLVTAETVTAAYNISHSSYTAYMSHTLDDTSSPPGGELAYIIYTSGTSGKPKGNLTTHANVTRVTHNMNYIRLTGTDRLLQLSNYAFDGSVFDIFGALLNGAALVLIKKEALVSMEEISRAITREAITVFFTTTALFNALVDTKLHCLTRTRKILFGGENISLPHAKKALRCLGPERLIHVYGPTETTVYATYFPINEIPENAYTVPIGKPVSKTVIYIFNNYMQLAPVGVPGEITIGGDGVARGYLNRPELTDEKFIHNYNSNKLYMSYSSHLSHSSHSSHLSYMSYKNDIFYRTGDLARWHNDGNIEFIGRIDHQVKLRGYRIELGEIENHLKALAGIKSAVVLAGTDHTGEKYICAYITSENQLAIDAIKEKLARTLPTYMIPAYIVQLEEIPLTPNGKVNRRALPEPAMNISGTYTPPGNQLEEKLAKIWQTVLGSRKPIGIHDNFFESGGHSLKATTMVSKIYEEMNVKIPLTEIFNTPTISGLSGYLRKVEKERYETITPVEKKEYYPVSSSQKRLYILQHMGGAHTGYNVPQFIPLGEKVDVEHLESCFKRLIARHDSLRTSFHLVNDAPVQRIHDRVEFKIEEISHPKGDETHIKTFIRPFDLAQAPLLRVGLVKKENRQQVLIVDMHHIITDGTSQTLLAGEFNRLSAGNNLPPLRLQYKDYTQWQADKKQQAAVKHQETYWHECYPSTGEIPVLDLPTDYSRQSFQGFQGKGVDFFLGSSETQTVNQLARQANTTLFMVILSVYTILLAKLSGQVDIIIGTPIAARRHVELEAIIGMFVNTLALRNYPSAHKWYTAFLAEVKEKTLGAFENQEYPFEDLVEKIALPRETSRNPLFDVMFNMINQVDFNTETITETGLLEKAAAAPRHGERNSKFDLTLTAIDRGREIFFSLTYSARLFKPETIDRYIEYFKKIVQSLAENPEQTIAELEIITAAEREQLVFRFNETEDEHPEKRTLPELFAHRVHQTPDNIALAGNGKTQQTDERTPDKPQLPQLPSMSYISYSELNRQARRLASVLKEKGVKPDTIVGLKTERSLEMIVGVLGIILAGAAYLPIDPNYPQKRIEYMLADSNASLLVTGETLSALPLITGNPLQTDTPFRDALAYVIYTSGSTGKPKGVMIQQGSAVNVVCWYARTYHLQPGIHIMLMSDYTFDPSVNQIFGTLLFGATLHIISKEMLVQIEILRRYIRTHGIHIIHFVPTVLMDLLGSGEKLESVRVVLSGGERLEETVKDRLIEKGYRLFNQYGPTETAIDALAGPCTPGKVTLGRPITNVQCYIYDPCNYLVPVGVTGELFIGGAGLARGYLNRPELTSEKFIYNPNKLYMSYMSHLPHQSYTAYSSTKLYRTGDLARWQPDGNIEFLGRKDHQVKIRGLRIELGEIENHLLKNKHVKAAVVVEKEKQLCAYIVSENEIDTTTLRESLALNLPEHMIPTSFQRLERIPLTTQGKIDRKALPNPRTQQSDNYIPPRNGIEKTLVRLYSEVLGRDDHHRTQLLSAIGIHDHFFALGGHSLKATILVSRITREFNVNMSLVEVFNAPTVKQLAEILSAKVTDSDLVTETADPQLVPLKTSKTGKTGETGENHLFLVHEGSGEVEGYLEFCRNLEPPEAYNCWGIRAENYPGYAPRDISIETIAAGYIGKIKTIQPTGPYRLMGWSVGGTIAFEMVRQLEQTHQPVEFFAMIDTASPITQAEIKAPGFTPETETKWIKRYLPGEAVKQVEMLNNTGEIWEFLVRYLETNSIDPGIIRQAITQYENLAIPNYRELGPGELIRYLNMLRSYHKARVSYIPREKIDAPLHYFKAGQTRTIRHEDWREYTRGHVRFYEITGDHYSIFKLPAVKKLAAIFNEILP